MSGLEPVIMRNGRSTSEISIYDYPEHLNPFYEDDNHKRLRFWKLGKKSGDGRRGSFSLSGLKEMWAFKSFRLKKKSSNLGVSKTSESPPPLRREIEPNGIYYGTYDPRMRYTTGNNTIGHSPFQRNVPYRSSLQDMRGTETIAYSGDFIRNNRYRSTIQTPGLKTEGSGSSSRVPARRYVYGGSATPQPSIRSNNYSEDYNAISRGSSQISVASTNPFEDDDDDVVMGRLSTAHNENGVQTPTKRPARKKRRAPPPPVPVSKVIIEETSNPSSPTTSQANQNIETVENSEIANLTAEFENFVKTTTDSSEKINAANESSNSTNPTITITTVVDKQEETEEDKDVTANTTDITIETSTTSNHVDDVDTQTVEEVKKVEVSQSVEGLKKVEVTQAVEELEKVEIVQTVEDLEKVEAKQPVNKDVEDVVVREISVEKDTPQHHLPTVLTDIEVQETNEHVENVNENNLDKSETNTEVGLSVVELKITESKEDLSERSERSERSEISELSEHSEISNEPVRNSRFQIRYIPLKDSSPESETEPEMRTSTPVQLRDDMDETNGVTYERRRSVREIIESINRSQSLLKVNQETNTPTKCDTVINNLNQPQAPPRRKIEERTSLAQNFKELAESEREIKKMIDQMDHTEINERKDYDEKEVNVMIDKLTDKLNNNEDSSEMFKKCTIKKEINRESSPTASNLDWNPVPKPKRTKNLSPELTKASFKQNNIRK